MIKFSDIDLVIFDLDGTLIDSVQDLANCLDLAMREEGLPPMPMDEIIRRIGIGSKNLMKELVNHDHIASERVQKYYVKHYSDRMFENTVLYPNVVELLDKLKDKKVALLSNKREAPCKKILQYFKIDHHFKMVLGGDSLPQRKPHPAPILHICNALDCKPERTLMVGDSPVDLEAGYSAGALTVGLLRGLTPEEEMRKNKAHMFYDQVGDLLDLING